MIDRVINGIYDDALRPFGLTASQMNILHMTAEAGVARASDMCRTLHLDTSTISRNVARMRQNGLLEVVPGGDARSRPFRVTEKGNTILAEADPAWRNAQQQARQRLGEDGLKWLDAILQRISHSRLQRECDD
jgi:DNA-binding MarR family transcriptional regulator